MECEKNVFHRLKSPGPGVDVYVYGWKKGGELPIFNYEVVIRNSVYTGLRLLGENGFFFFERM